jgi:hypothetical protein
MYKSTTCTTLIFVRFHQTGDPDSKLKQPYNTDSPRLGSKAAYP